MTNILRQIRSLPGVNTVKCVERWKDYSIDKLTREEERLQELYFTVKGNPALENQARIIIEHLQKYIQTRYKKEEKENQKKLNI